MSTQVRSVTEKNEKLDKAIELQLNDLKLYLENNYKDLAIEALRDGIAIALLKEVLKESGVIILVK